MNHRIEIAKPGSGNPESNPLNIWEIYLRIKPDSGGILTYRYTVCFSELRKRNGFETAETIAVN